MKVCSKCKIEKELTEFYKHKSHKDGYATYCKICNKAMVKRYVEQNKDKVRVYRVKYRENNQEKMKIYRVKYNERNKEKRRVYRTEQKRLYPWKLTLQGIKQRCNKPNTKYYKNYGGRGIKCLITKEELKELWFRDKAFDLNQASIDRIDNNGHYEYSNCRYIEMVDNSKKGNKLLA